MLCLHMTFHIVYRDSLREAFWLAEGGPMGKFLRYYLFTLSPLGGKNWAEGGWPVLRMMSL